MTQMIKSEPTQSVRKDLRKKENVKLLFFFGVINDLRFRRIQTFFFLLLRVRDKRIQESHEWNDDVPSQGKHRPVRNNFLISRNAECMIDISKHAL